jgi:hypothetical protein
VRLRNRSNGQRQRAEVAVDRRQVHAGGSDAQGRSITSEDVIDALAELFAKQLLRSSGFSKPRLS